MIRLGLRLSVGGGREAASRVALVASAVALGVGLLLVSLAGVNGLNAQTTRGAWLDTSQGTPATGGSASPLWWLYTVDEFTNLSIDRVDVAATGPDAPLPPGIPNLPGPGQYYASPALTTLMRSLPADELHDRYPGRQIGTIGAAALPSPGSLVIVIGHDAAQLSQAPGAFEVRSIQRTPAACFRCGVGSGSDLKWILVGGAVALLLPVLILIATASRLSAARREERFAAMRLVGATPSQISVVATVEATVAAAAGMAVGFALFFAFRPLLVHVPFGGSPFAPGDLTLRWPDIALVVIGVPVAAALSARMALRRVQVSPLGVTRRVASAQPRAVRVVPLLAGIALLAYFDLAGKPGSNGGQIQELLVSFLLIGVGLVLAGPWLTTAGSRLLALRARRPAGVIAGRRLLDNPKAAFRFISGLVIALFITSAAIGTLSSVVAAGANPAGSAARATVADPFCAYVASPCDRSTQVRSVPAKVLADLRSTPGVTGVAVIHQSAATSESGASLVSCSELAQTPAIGRCAPGVSVATIGFFLSNLLGHHSPASNSFWPSAHLSAAAIAGLPVDAVVVATNGSPASIERARTALEMAFPFKSFNGTPVAVDALNPSTARLLTMVQNITDVIVVASLIIAACSLAVNIAGGLSERKRPFSLLRLTGVPVAVLQRVVALESAMPLFVVAAVSIAVGLVSGALFLHSQVGIPFRIPGVAYWATVAGGLVASMAIIGATFPLLRRITGPEVARND